MVSTAMSKFIILLALLVIPLSGLANDRVYKYQYDMEMCLAPLYGVVNMHDSLVQDEYRYDIARARNIVTLACKHLVMYEYTREEHEVWETIIYDSIDRLIDVLPEPRPIERQIKIN